MKYTLTLSLIILFGFSLAQQYKDEFYLNIDKAKSFQRSNIDSAHYYANIAINLSRNLGNDTMVAEAQNVDAIIYLRMGEFKKGLDILKDILTVYQKRNMEINMASVLVNIGLVFSNLNQYDSAMVYQYRALEVYEKFQDSSGIQSAIHSIGTNLSKIKEYDKSNSYYRRSYEIACLIKDTVFQFETICNIGLNYRALHNYDSALYCFNSYLDYQLKKPNPFNLGLVHTNLGLVYMDIGESRKALASFNKSIKNLEIIGHQWGIANAYNNMAETYYDVNKYDSSIVCSVKAAEIIKEMNFPELKRDISYSLYQAYYNKGNMKKALDYFIDFTRLKDTVFNLDKLKVTQNIETKYETAKKESENVKLKSEIEINKFKSQRRNIIEFFVLFAFVTAIAVILLMRKNLKQKHKLMLHDSDMLKQKLEFSKQELASKALHLACQNEFRAKMLETTNEIYDNLDDKGKAVIKSLLSDLENNIDSSAWSEFETRFEQVHESFFIQLNTLFPDLTQNDRRICAFLKLNMSTKEIALLIHRSPRSVESSRYRLRKKFELPKDTDIVNFLQNIG